MSDEIQDISEEQHSPGELLHELGSLKELLDEEHTSVTPYTSVNEISSVEEYLRLKEEAATANLSIEEFLSQQATIEPIGDELELLDDDDGETIPLLDEVYTVEDEAEDDSESLLHQVAEEQQEDAHFAAESSRVEAYFASVAAAKRPQQNVSTAPSNENPTPSAIPVLEEVFQAEEPISVLDTASSSDEIPVLEDVATENSSSTTGTLDLSEVQELVDLIVNRKLQQLKPVLEQEVMGELQKLLPSLQ